MQLVFPPGDRRAVVESGWVQGSGNSARWVRGELSWEEENSMQDVNFAYPIHRSSEANQTFTLTLALLSACTGLHDCPATPIQLIHANPLRSPKHYQPPVGPAVGPAGAPGSRGTRQARRARGPTSKVWTLPRRVGFAERPQVGRCF